MGTDRLVYVYGIVPSTLDVAGAPAGVDARLVELVSAGAIAALVSSVDEATYGASTMEARVGELGWLAPRAAAHDAVMTWASDAGPVVPLPLLSLFRSAGSVREMLDARTEELTGILARVARGREYGVRLFRVDAELERALPSLSPRIAELERAVSAAAAPGQRYLLARKLTEARKAEMRDAAATVAARAFDVLAARALAAEEGPLPEASRDQPGAAVLNASFLVAHEMVDAFREAVTSLVHDYQPRGFRVEFTGPWPPYHFTRSTGDGR